MRKSISRYARLVGVLLLGSGLLMTEPAHAQATRTVSKTLDLDADGRVALKAFAGSIEVTTWDREAVQVDVRIEADEQELVDKTRIRIDGGGHRVDIETDYDEVEDSQKFLGLFNIGSVDKPETHYTLRMPRTAALTINDFSSDIEVAGLRADVRINTFSSNIRLRDIEGQIRAETFSSRFVAEDIAGGVRLKTFSGDADITMRALTADTEFESFSGDVRLTLPANAGFRIDTDRGMGGDVRSDFALADSESDEEHFQGTVGAGGPWVQFETFSGDFELRKR